MALTLVPVALLDLVDDISVVKPSGTAVLRANGGGVSGYMFGSQGGGVVGVGSESNHPYVFYVNGVERGRIDTSGNMLLTTAASLGYGTGSGGTVTQLTNKQTAVTLNKPAGQIITANSALAAGIITGFQFNNTLIAATDIVNVSVVSPASGYQAWIYYTTAGYCFVAVKNNSAGSLSEAVTLNFAIIKGVTA